MTSPDIVLRKKKAQVDAAVPKYLKSKAFELVAKKALEDFIKRVKRGIMPDMGKIPALDSEDYVELRKRYKDQLGRLGKPPFSNATATGQMLDAMIYEITTTGFVLFVAESERNGELSGAESRLNNAEVASYYAKTRKIFDFSKPEINRLIRVIRSDLIKIITASK